MDAKDGKMHAFAVDILGMMDFDSCKYLLCLLSFQWSPNRDQNTANNHLFDETFELSRTSPWSDLSGTAKSKRLLAVFEPIG